MKRGEPLNRSAQRTITVLEYLAAADGPRDLAVISRELKMNKSTVYRFLTTLAENGYVTQQSPSGKYTLGSKVTWLASKFLEKNPLTKISRPYLEELSRTTGETVHLAVLDHNEVSYIDKVDGRQAVLMASRIGARMPVHSTALGKAILSGRPEQEWQRYVAEVGLFPRTANTFTDPDAFYQELHKVRREMYALDDVENEEGIRCVAAPIKDVAGNHVAAVSISGWTLTMTLERAISLAPILIETAAQISAQLGFHSQTQADTAAAPSTDGIGLSTNHRQRGAPVPKAETGGD